MNLKDFSKIKDEYYKKNVLVTLNNEKKYIGIYDSEFTISPIIFVGREQIKIEDIKSIELFNDNQIYKYVLVSLDEDEEGEIINNRQSYYYKTTLNKINVGNHVLVECNGKTVYGYVESVGFYTRETAPYPVDKTKNILSILESNYIDNFTCPLIDDLIYDDECLDTQSIADGFIKEEHLSSKYKTKENWREVCKNCKYHQK